MAASDIAAAISVYNRDLGNGLEFPFGNLGTRPQPSVPNRICGIALNSCTRVRLRAGRFRTLWPWSRALWDDVAYHGRDRVRVAAYQAPQCIAGSIAICNDSNCGGRRSC